MDAKGAITVIYPLIRDFVSVLLLVMTSAVSSKFEIIFSDPMQTNVDVFGSAAATLPENDAFSNNPDDDSETFHEAMETARSPSASCPVMHLTAFESPLADTSSHSTPGNESKSPFRSSKISEDFEVKTQSSLPITDGIPTCDAKKLNSPQSVARQATHSSLASTFVSDSHSQPTRCEKSKPPTANLYFSNDSSAIDTSSSTANEDVVQGGHAGTTISSSSSFQSTQVPATETQIPRTHSPATTEKEFTSRDVWSGVLEDSPHNKLRNSGSNRNKAPALDAEATTLTSSIASEGKHLGSVHTLVTAPHSGVTVREYTAAHSSSSNISKESPNSRSQSSIPYAEGMSACDMPQPSKISKSTAVAGLETSTSCSLYIQPNCSLDDPSVALKEEYPLQPPKSKTSSACAVAETSEDEISLDSGERGDDVHISTSQSQATKTTGTPRNMQEPDMDQIRAMHAARRSSRRRASASSSLDSSTNALPSFISTDISKLSLQSCSNDSENEKALAALHAAHAVEIQSIHRNHIENLKKIANERDMFAAQLVKEQSESKPFLKETNQINALQAQLRAARIRTTDLQEENARLLHEVKQLRLLIQAEKTQQAEASSYAAVVEQLVNVKMQCAQLDEEKESLRRSAREAAASVTMLKNANGDLEKSRADWVRQCAELELAKRDLEQTNEALINERALSKTYGPSASRRPRSTPVSQSKASNFSASFPSTSTSTASGDTADEVALE